MRLVLLLMAASVVGTPATAAAAASTQTGRLLVTLRPAARSHGSSAYDATAGGVIASNHARRAGPSVPQIRLITVRPRAGESLADLTVALQSDPRVRAVQRERRATPRLLPDDPALSVGETSAGTLPGTPLEWWAAAENLPAAWDITQGAGARVAVIDTGVDASHPDLARQIIAANDLDGDATDRGVAVDEDGHGTHVASLACATGGNGLGLVGAGYGCSLIVEKTDFTDASIAAAIVDASDRGAGAINMSFGTDGRTSPGPALLDALHYARRRGAVLVAAAADDPVTEQGDPANVLQPTGTGPRLEQGIGLSVTAAQRDGHVAWFGGRGTQISLAAYGAFARTSGPRGVFGAFPLPTVGIEVGQGSRPPCLCRTSLGGDDRYAYIAGTSMAAPQVAAIAALMRRLNPDLPPANVERILKRTATRPAGVGWTNDLGWGILNGGAAMAAARDTDHTPPTSSLTVVRRSARSVTLRVGARDAGPPGVRVSGPARVEVWQTIGTTRRRIASTGVGITRLRIGGRRAILLTVRAVDRAGNHQALAVRPQLRLAAPQGQAFTARRSRSRSASVTSSASAAEIPSAIFWISGSTS